MGGCSSGAMNAVGFSRSIAAKNLPSHDHLTHSGVFNENYFSIGDRAKSLLQIHHGQAVSNCDLYDLDNRNYFVSLFMKSSADGQPRTQRLNVVITLDVSGSMNGALKYTGYQEEVKQKSRLDLARQAILMLFKKMQPEDAFSLVTFHTEAQTIIPSSFVKDLSFEEVEQKVMGPFQSGGTTIAAGFHQAMSNLLQFKTGNTLTDYQSRIVMLTDVCDNSVAGQQKLINQISESGVHTTIIGVSTDFQSSTCEKLIAQRGFNYMCAVQNSDLQTYLVDQFDYTFFPCVQDTTITIESDQIESIETFGTVDYDVRYPVEGNVFTVTKMKSGFPSALQRNKKGQLETKGGLILVKFVPKVKEGLPKLDLRVGLTYSDMAGKQYKELYTIDRLVEAEEYYSDEAAKKGVELFYYVQTIRNLLKDMNSSQKALSDSNKEFYLAKLGKLREICPKDKEEQLRQLIEIVEQK